MSNSHYCYCYDTLDATEGSEGFPLTDIACNIKTTRITVVHIHLIYYPHMAQEESVNIVTRDLDPCRGAIKLWCWGQTIV